LNAEHAPNISLPQYQASICNDVLDVRMAPFKMKGTVLQAGYAQHSLQFLIRKFRAIQLANA
jgi:hypothetical protein